MVIFFEQSIVFNRPLLELHVYAAAVDADDAPDATDEKKDVTPHKAENAHKALDFWSEESLTPRCR